MLLRVRSNTKFTCRNSLQILCRAHTWTHTVYIIQSHNSPLLRDQLLDRSYHLLTQCLLSNIISTSSHRSRSTKTKKTRIESKQRKLDFPNYTNLRWIINACLIPIHKCKKGVEVICNQPSALRTRGEKQQISIIGLHNDLREHARHLKTQREFEPDQ